VIVVSFLEAGRGEWWRYGAGSCRCVETILFHLWGCAGDFDGWCLEGEGLGLDNLASVCVLDFVALAVFSGRVGVHVHRVARRWSPAARARRHGTEARCVGRGLRAELSKIEIGAGTVTLGHGLPELPLGPESVEDDSVDGDTQDFNDYLDDAAHKSPVLQGRQ